MEAIICTKCNNKLAISPEGLCNICDKDALKKRLASFAPKPKDNN